MDVSPNSGRKDSLLIIGPPVLVPTQVPVGALIFSAAAQASGFNTRLYDASLEYFRFILALPDEAQTEPSAWRRGRAAVRYFQQNRMFDPHVHRSHINNLHRLMAIFSEQFPGWKITLTNATFAQIQPYDPEEFVKFIRNGGRTPFSAYYEQKLLPSLQTLGGERIGVSLSYLSQVYAALELAVRLNENGVRPVLGGALVHVLDTRIRAQFDFNGLFQRDDADLMAVEQNVQNLTLRWPKLQLDLDDYFVPVPIIPFSLSDGCYWNKCLFCPDTKKTFSLYQLERLEPFLAEAYTLTRQNELIFNISDSSIPAPILKKMLPFFYQHPGEFYGFVRFDRPFADAQFLHDIRHAGGRLLQFGLESGSQRLLDLYQKGVNLEQARHILHLSNAAGIRNYNYLLFGLPTETEEDRHATRIFVENNHEAIHHLNLSIFNLPADCDMLKTPDMFSIEPVELQKYAAPLQLYLPFQSKGESVRKDARRFIHSVLHKNPVFRALIKNTPDRLRVDHAVFFDEA
ncbi:radical SAM protein [bacterium]|nr:radical SAM protein [bacterium]